MLASRRALSASLQRSGRRVLPAPRPSPSSSSSSRRLLARAQSAAAASDAADATATFTPRERELQRQGLLDERGLTVFHTLHEMQVNSCRVFAEKQLFGTYSEASQRFEWMSFQDYADQVDRCRAMLKDLGASSFRRGLRATDRDAHGGPVAVPFHSG